ncbi:hypothetical protein [Propionibacterium phage pa29399-1-D_2]|nr:hypothetical protein [Propionibacterium phage pa29399-1-D_2]
MCGGVVVFSTTPMGVRKITSPPAVSKEEGHERKMGEGMCSRFKA